MVAESTDWLSDAEQQVWRRLLSVNCRLKERLDHELQAGCGLTLGEYDVLVHLSEAPGGALRMSELADRLLLSRSGLTRRIDTMAKNGLVARRPCRDDGRGALAELTPAGFEMIERAAPVHVTGVRRYLLGPLSGADEAAEQDGRGGSDGRGDPEAPVDPAAFGGSAGLAGVARGLARIERALSEGVSRS